MFTSFISPLTTASRGGNAGEDASSDSRLNIRNSLDTVRVDALGRRLLAAEPTTRRIVFDGDTVSAAIVFNGRRRSDGDSRARLSSNAPGARFNEPSISIMGVE